MENFLSGLLVALILIVVFMCYCNPFYKNWSSYTGKEMKKQKEKFAPLGPEGNSIKPVGEYRLEDKYENRGVSYMTKGEENKNLYEPVPGYEDYDNFLLNVGVDEQVIKSHKEFSDEINHNSTGSSSQTVLSGDVYDNPWVGLRRPSTNVTVSDGARQVPSAYQQQYPSTSRYYKGDNSLF